MSLVYTRNTTKPDSIIDKSPSYGGWHHVLKELQPGLRWWMNTQDITDNTRFAMLRTIWNKELDAFLRKFKHPTEKDKPLYFSHGLADLFHRRTAKIMTSSDKNAYYAFDVVSGQDWDVSIYLPRTHIIRTEWSHDMQRKKWDLLTLIDHLMMPGHLEALQIDDSPQNYQSHQINKMLKRIDRVPNPLVRLEEPQEFSWNEMKVIVDMLMWYEYRYQMRQHYD